jgi:hypothetical protein
MQSVQVTRIIGLSKYLDEWGLAQKTGMSTTISRSRRLRFTADRNSVRHENGWCPSAIWRLVFNRIGAIDEIESSDKNIIVVEHSISCRILSHCPDAHFPLPPVPTSDVSRVETVRTLAVALRDT